jgi:hypothetical protein
MRNRSSTAVDMMGSRLEVGSPLLALLTQLFVMAGLVPAIHAFLDARQ